jgi:PilZ domain
MSGCGTDRRRSSRPVENERRTGERRQEPRFALDLWIEAEEGEALYFQRIGNLSAGGCSFLQTVPRPLGTKMWLRFRLPDAPLEEIGCQGEIASTRGDGLGMGVRFLELSDQIKERIRGCSQYASQQLEARREADRGRAD